MDILKIAQAIRPDITVTEVDGPIACPDGMRQWWIFSPDGTCVGTILAQAYDEKDEVTECILHKIDFSLTVYE